jgi:hypothetical protein
MENDSMKYKTFISFNWKNVTDVSTFNASTNQQIQQYIFQQMHNLIFIYDKLGLHVSVYQAIIKAPITKNTKNTASQNK